MWLLSEAFKVYAWDPCINSFQVHKGNVIELINVLRIHVRHHAIDWEICKRIIVSQHGKGSSTIVYVIQQYLTHKSPLITMVQ